jgi:hypothetical protein
MGRGPSTLEVPADWCPTSSAYVAVRFEGELSKVRVLNETTCDHVANICTSCAHMWEWDYDVLYDNTVGGRRLKAMRSN